MSLLVKLLACLTLLISLASLAQAQTNEPTDEPTAVPTEVVEPTPEPEPVIDNTVIEPVDEVAVEVIPIERAAELMLASIIAILGGAASSPLVTFIVGLLKFPFKNINPQILSFGTAAIVTASMWVAGRAGYEVKLQSVFDFVLIIGPALITLASSLFGATATYHAASAKNVPIMGYSGSNKRVWDDDKARVVSVDRSALLG